MISTSLQTVGYLVAALLFIQSLGGLSRASTAQRGNVYGIIGMALALAVTFLSGADFAWPYAVGALVVGAAIGVFAASRVAMTAMPEMVAILNSFVGLAATLVGFANFIEPAAATEGAAHVIHLIETYLAVSIGALTFTGSAIAWGKLSGRLSGAPFLVPARHLVNLALVVGLVVVAVFFVRESDPAMGLNLLLINVAIASVLGIQLVLAIGGADMPVVVSLLNSYSGWSAAAAGFMLSNDLLIVTGALVGSSGAILSIVMCRGMNRSIWNVVLGGFGGSDARGSVDTEQGEAISVSPPEVARTLVEAKSVVIVPGYGMAVARAQHAVSELAKRLRDKGISVRFGIHPVAGRMPGHMNVLLAEADIPYKTVLELETINPEFDETDVVLTIGANDIVNPDALVDRESPIYGMPQLHVWKGERVIVFKRSLSPGYAGVPNPLFFRDNTRMCFGDAEETVSQILESL